MNKVFIFGLVFRYYNLNRVGFGFVIEGCLGVFLGVVRVVGRLDRVILKLVFREVKLVEELGWLVLDRCGVGLRVASVRGVLGV